MEMLATLVLMEVPNHPNPTAAQIEAMSAATMCTLTVFDSDDHQRSEPLMVTVGPLAAVMEAMELCAEGYEKATGVRPEGGTVAVHADPPRADIVGAA